MASRRFEDLHPDFQPIAREIIKRVNQKITSGWEAFITDGLRDMEEQRRIYAQGRTAPGKIVSNAKPGQSPHNFGLAIDVAFKRKSDGKVAWLYQFYDNYVAPVARSLGCDWGGDWKDFVDRPHIQMSGWRWKASQMDGYALNAPSSSMKTAYQKALAISKQLANGETVNTGGSGMSSDIYEGFDLNNLPKESVKEFIKVWAAQRDGKIISKEQAEARVKEAVEAIRSESDKRVQEVRNELNKQLKEVAEELKQLKEGRDKTLLELNEQLTAVQRENKALNEKLGAKTGQVNQLRKEYQFLIDQTKQSADKFLPGWKSYLTAGAVLLYGVYGLYIGDMTVQETMNYIFASGAITSLRFGIAKAEKPVVKTE